MTDTVNNAGYKTSEFWVTVIVGLLVALNQSGILGDFKIPVEAMNDIITLAVSFVLGRFGLKAVAGAVKTNADAKVAVAEAQASGTGTGTPTTVTVNNTPPSV